MPGLVPGIHVFFTPEPSTAFAVSVQGAGATSRTRRETDMRVLTLAALLALPADVRVHPVKGAVHGTATAASGVGRGTVTAARGVGRGAVCLFTLGTRCR